MKPTRELAQGKWGSILPAVGIDPKFLTNKNGPCPICGGKDRFRFDDKEGFGTWYCNQCPDHSGNGFKLVMLKLGLTEFKDAAKTVDAVLSNRPIPASAAGKKPIPADRQRDDMNKVWVSGRRLDAKSVAGRYLINRVGDSALSALDLRAVAALPHFAPGERVPSHHPALIALVRDREGKPINVHRTWLNPAGGKAAVTPPKKVMPGSISAGSAVRLQKQAPIIGVAEGIESALSASVLFQLPVWAVLSAVNLERFIPPEGVKELLVFADNDGCSKHTKEPGLGSFTGQAAGYALARRLRADPNFDALKIHVHIPPEPGHDWNDVQRAGNGPAPIITAFD